MTLLETKSNRNWASHLGNWSAALEHKERKRVAGIGGIFFKAEEPAKLAAWYQSHLGVDTQWVNSAEFH